MTSPESTARPIRVLVVDDHEVVRRGLAVFLMAHPDLKLVGEARHGREAIERCAELAPDVVLMDLQMPIMDGVAATQEIRKHHPQTQVIALTSFAEDHWVKRALAAGAIGYLLKDAGVQALTAAIREAYAGRPTLAPEAAEALIRSTLAPETCAVDLTDREREVLALMVEGLSNAEIAGRLVISESTAKYHVSNILAKLQVSSRTEAVSRALQDGLISP